MFGNKDIVLTAVKEMPNGNETFDYTFAVLNESKVTRAARLVKDTLIRNGAADAIGNLRAERTDAGTILVHFTIAGAFDKIGDNED